MRDLITNFPDQLDESVEISKAVNIELDRKIDNVIICGLGGSGIGGEIVKTWFKSSTVLPIEVCHSYDLPNYASSSSLIITCSYSGNTEETLSALEQAIEADAFIIGITSGGKLEEIINGLDMPVVKVPGGLPPRSALGYPLVQLVKVLCSTVAPNNDLLKELSSSSDFLRNHQEGIIQIAKDILGKVGSRNMLFYSEEKFEPVGLRACQQINENSKELAFRNVVPEMNHNEIVGWAKEPENLYTIFLRSNLERENNKRRLDITEKVISDRTDKVMSIKAIGENLVHQTFYFIHIVDWVSLLKAEQKNIDVEEVKVIDYLKNQLSKG